MPDTGGMKRQSEQAARFKDAASKNDGPGLIGDPAGVRVKRSHVAPRAIEAEDGYKADSRGSDIKDVFQYDFVVARNAQFYGANAGGIDTGPTNAGDRVWCDRTKRLEI
jgi:hypothetical protein